MKYTPKSSDQELIQGCILKNRLAQKYLYQKYFGKLLGVSMRYTKDREQGIEVLNLAFFKILESIASYKETGAFQGWMARIVFNTAIDQIRKNARYKKHMDFESKKETAINSEAINNLEVEDLYKVIQKLPPASRAVFSMYAIDGFKHHEIAAELDISVGTSKWHLSSARKKLKELLKSYIHTEISL